MAGGWGISIELWRRIATDLHPRFRLKEVSLGELINGTATHRLDAAIAASTVTAEREDSIDFFQPYYSSGLLSSQVAWHAELAMKPSMLRAHNVCIDARDLMHIRIRQLATVQRFRRPVSHPKISAPDLHVGSNFPGITVHHHSAGLQHISTVGDLQRLVQTLLDN